MPTAFEGFKSGNTIIPCKDVSAFPRSEQAVLGAVNFCKNTRTTPKEEYDVTFTPQADESIVISGTPTGKAEYDYLHIFVPAGTYMLSGLKDTTNVIYEAIYYYNNGTYSTIQSIESADDTVITIPSGYTIDDNHYFGVIIKRSNNGVACSGTAKIMFTLGTSVPSVFAPYAYTNKKLTDIVNDTDLTFTEASEHTNVTQVVVNVAKLNKRIIISVYCSIGAGLSDYVTIGNIAGLGVLSAFAYPTPSTEPRVFIGANGDIKVYSQTSTKVNYTIII